MADRLSDPTATDVDRPAAAVGGYRGGDRVESPVRGITPIITAAGVAVVVDGEAARRNARRWVASDEPAAPQGNGRPSEVQEDGANEVRCT